VRLMPRRATFPLSGTILVMATRPGAAHAPRAALRESDAAGRADRRHPRTDDDRRRPLLTPRFTEHPLQAVTVRAPRARLQWTASLPLVGRACGHARRMSSPGHRSAPCPCPPGPPEGAAP